MHDYREKIGVGIQGLNEIGLTKGSPTRMVVHSYPAALGGERGSEVGFHEQRVSRRQRISEVRWKTGLKGGPERLSAGADRSPTRELSFRPKGQKRSTTIRERETGGGRRKRRRKKK